MLGLDKRSISLHLYTILVQHVILPWLYHITYKVKVTAKMKPIYNSGHLYFKAINSAKNKRDLSCSEVIMRTKFCGWWWQSNRNWHKNMKSLLKRDDFINIYVHTNGLFSIEFVTYLFTRSKVKLKPLLLTVFSPHHSYIIFQSHSAIIPKSKWHITQI